MKKLLIAAAFSLFAIAAKAQPAYPFYQGAVKFNSASSPASTIATYTLGYPSIFNGSGDNPCTTGNCVFTLSLAAQNAGTFWGVDFSGANPPSFINPSVGDGQCLARSGTAWVGAACSGAGTRVVNLSLESPGAAENAGGIYFPAASTITEVRCVVVGSTPSVTPNLKYGTDRSAAGTSVTTTPSACTNTTGGATATLNNTAIPSGGYLWLVTTAQSGTVNWLNIAVSYTTP